MNPEQIELYEPEANTWWVGELTPQADLGAGAVFGHFVDAKRTLRLAMVRYPDADLAFTVTDWQGVQPDTPADIPLFTWRCGSIDALLLDGRPVLPPWASWENTSAEATTMFQALPIDAQRVVLDALAGLGKLAPGARQTALQEIIDAMEAQLASEDAISTEQEKPL